MKQVGFLALVALVAWVDGVQADRGPLFPEPKSPYDFLGDYFDAGDVPDVSQLKGWHSGRCFQKLAPENVYGSMLALFEKNQKPHDPALLNYEMVNHFFSLAPANAFDAGNYNDSHVASIQASVEEWMAGVPKDPKDKATYQLGTLEKQADFWEVTSESKSALYQETASLRVRLKTYKGYFITQGQTVIERDSKKSVWETRCYYFTPMVPRP